MTRTPMTRKGAAIAIALATLAVACPPNTDLTVAPPKVVPKVVIDVPPPLDSGRLPAWQVPTHYTIDLDIDPSSDRFSGEVVIDVTLAQPTNAFILHAGALRIHGAELIVGGAAIAAETTFRPAAGAAEDDADGGGQVGEELVVTTQTEIAPGEVKLHLDYSGPLDEVLRGVYRVKDDDSWFVFTQFEPSDARRMFPCFDDPIYKTTFDLKITTPRENDAFANTPLASKEARDGGKKNAFAFATSKKMPTYLVSIAVGPLEAQEGSKSPVPIRVIAPRGRTTTGDFALKTAKAHLDILVDYFGSPYPYAKLDLLAVPNFGPGAMENAGLVSFREELLLVDAKTASAKSRRDHISTMAHELAHMWFGNLVTMNWWDDLWLNEGFATYAEVLVMDRHAPEMRAELELLSWVGWVMDFDALSSARAVRQPVANTYEAEEAFDGITYFKGAAVIKMLHRWIGDEAFREGIRNYMAKHAWGNAGGSDMFNALGAASGKPVGQVASTFLDKGGVPLVRATMTCERGKAPRVELSQQRYRGTESATSIVDDPLWRIPVCVSWARKGRKAKLEKTCVVLADRRATFDLATERCPSWLLPNAGYDGYYRYALDDGELDKLAKATTRHDTTHRIGFLTNLWALVQAGETPATKLLDIVLASKGEKDRAVIEEITGILAHISDSLIEDKSRAKFEKLVRALLLPTAKKLGWDGRAGDSEDDRLMRRTVLGSLATLTTDPWMQKEAELRANAWLKDAQSVDADTSIIALRVAARNGSVSFERFKRALVAAKTAAERTTIIPAMGSFSSEKDLRRTLSLINDGTIRAQDAVYLARAAAEWPDSRAIFIAWLEVNLAAMAKKSPGFGVARMVATIRRLCDGKARNAAANAFKPIIDTLRGSDRRLREAIENADMCIDLRRRQANAVTAYLEKKKRF
jgi:alanyl aminopeptidase